MKKTLVLFVFLSVVLSGCASMKRLPSEDIEAPVLYSGLISVLKDPRLPSNSKEKYDAIRALIKKVDFTFTRETKTLNEYFAPQDAIIDLPEASNRRISFNYQYRDRYVRLTFFTSREFIFRVDIIDK